MKEYFPEEDTGEKLRQTHEGTFHWRRHRREDVLLKQARERHVMKDSSLTTHMYWSALHWVAKQHLSELHKEKHTNKLVVVCCSFLATSADSGWLAEWCQLEQTHVLSKTPGATRPIEDGYCPSFCPHRQEHTQDNRNLLRQSFYCLLIRREDPEPGKWCCLYTLQHDVSAPDVAWQLLIRCSPITPLLCYEMGSD